jgi:hypothetical protein
MNKEVEMPLRYWNIGKGSYPVFLPPYKWDTCYMLVNGWRFKDFQAVILFSNELVVRFDRYSDQQVNIPYRDIESFEVFEDIEIGYERLHQYEQYK